MRRRTMLRFFWEESLTVVSMLRWKPISQVQKNARSVSERTATGSDGRRKRIGRSGFKNIRPANSRNPGACESGAGRQWLRLFCEEDGRKRRWCFLQSRGGGPTRHLEWFAARQFFPDFWREAPGGGIR